MSDLDELILARDILRERIDRTSGDGQEWERKDGYYLMRQGVVVGTVQRYEDGDAIVAAVKLMPYIHDIFNEAVQSFENTRYTPEIGPNFMALARAITGEEQ